MYSPYTTCCVRVNEWESGLLEDFATLVSRLVADGGGKYYPHSMSLLLGSAGESIPVRAGELCLGTLQRILFLELDREEGRRWIVQAVGR